MSAIFRFVLKHGYSLLFAAIFAHQIGVPLPGPLFLVSAGALAAGGKLAVLPTIGLTIAACVLADWVWYEAGRRGGDKVLHFVHRISTRDPDFHDSRAKRIFARFGLPLLLVAKFVPGLDAVAPPLAGTSRTSRAWFLAVDGVGASLYAFVYGGLGYVFSHDLNRASDYVSRAGTVLLCLAAVAVSVFITRKLFRQVRMIRQSGPIQCGPADAFELEDSVDLPCGVAGEHEHGN